jgi:Fanconi anemia group M protein
MYNYYRWFPTGKVVFMAPTKPLVAQQIEACHGIMGIPQDHTAELQGSVKPEERKRLWAARRVFYCTPQSMDNDLKSSACDPSKIVCIVVDEAHKAQGNFAYCTVIKEIARATKHFRVLALSATPGADVASINCVLSNLCISHLEIRSEEDDELKQYRHARLEEVRINLNGPYFCNVEYFVSSMVVGYQV